MRRFSKRKLILLSPLFLIAFAAFVFLFGWVVMLLWNAIMVPAAGAGIISFWQALGLLILSRILVGGFSGRRYRRGNNWKDKWENMNDEKKEAIKEKIKQRWGSRFPDEPTANESSESK